MDALPRLVRLLRSPYLPWTPRPYRLTVAHPLAGAPAPRVPPDYTRLTADLLPALLERDPLVQLWPPAGPAEHHRLSAVQDAPRVARALNTTATALARALDATRARLAADAAGYAALELRYATWLLAAPDPPTWLPRRPRPLRAALMVYRLVCARYPDPLGWPFSSLQALFAPTLPPPAAAHAAHPEDAVLWPVAATVPGPGFPAAQILERAARTVRALGPRDYQAAVRLLDALDA